MSDSNNSKYSISLYWTQPCDDDIINLNPERDIAVYGDGVSLDGLVSDYMYLKPSYFWDINGIQDAAEIDGVPTEIFDSRYSEMKEGYGCYTSYGYNQGDQVVVLYKIPEGQNDIDDSTRGYIDHLLWDNCVSFTLRDENGDEIYSIYDFVDDWNEMRQFIINESLKESDKTGEEAQELKDFLEAKLPKEEYNIPTI